MCRCCPGCDTQKNKLGRLGIGAHGAAFPDDGQSTANGSFRAAYLNGDLSERKPGYAGERDQRHVIVSSPVLGSVDRHGPPRSSAVASG